MIIELWKQRIESYKDDYKVTILDYTIEVMLFIALTLFTPIIILFDIVLLPIYLIAFILKNRS